jgi:hypothetical protein
VRKCCIDVTLASCWTVMETTCSSEMETPGEGVENDEHICTLVASTHQRIDTIFVYLGRHFNHARTHAYEIRLY